MNKVKGFIKRNVTRVNVLTWIMLFHLFYSQTVYASGYTTQLTNLKTILITVATAIGGVMIVWGGISFAISFKKTNQQGEHDAIMTVAAGALMVGISAVVAALG